ncbi:glycosyltransferase family 39 protein [Chryseobacterium sp. 2TAF14]|uniref:protein O-mannosyl-transferase family n=1 Tax=Chryseobacterium sp. 2TAF14 TaxID=3233007 RepID=UPI003F92AA9B
MNKKFIPFLLFFLFLGVYYLSSFSKVSFGDGIGFLLDVEKELFTNQVTPLSHFLYLNTAIFFTKFCNIDSVMTMRLMSVVPAAISISLLYILIKKFIIENWIAITCSIVLGMSFTFWRSASTIEVYTFNAIWVIFFLLFSIKSLKSPSLKNLLLTGVFLGISMWVHIQNIMLIPAYCVLLYQLKHFKRSIFISVSLFTLIFCAMFLVNYLAEIPVKYTFITGTGTWIEDTFRQGPSELLKDLLKSFLFLVYNFNIFLIFIPLGIREIFKNHRNVFPFIAISFSFTFGFATFYAVSDNYVFFIPSYFMIIMMIGFGIKSLSMKYNLKSLQFITILIPLFYIGSYKIASLLPATRSFQEEKAYKGGLSYYMLPWLHNNLGCLEFTIEKRTTTDNVEKLREQSLEFIEIRENYQDREEIIKL